MRTKLLLINFLLLFSSLLAQETYVPDDNFEAYLETHGYGNGIANDNYVSTTAIQSVTVLAISNLGISDLTGLSDFSSLTTLNCSDNNISSIDLSFKRIFNVLATNNNLTYFNIKNGFNTDVNTFDVTNNPNLFCIEVDDATSNTLISWGKDTTARFKNDCTLTYVPDNNFENYLETHDAAGNVVTIGSLNSLGNGIAGDDYVETSKIVGITSLNIASKMIADITGIEDFRALEILDFSTNGVGDFDLSSNINLKELYCASNGMSSIDIGANVNLEILDCSDNSNTTIDVSTNIKLKELDISANGTTSLNLGSVSTLENINASNNNLTTLDLTNLSNLTDLNCSTNYNLNITDFSPLTSLIHLNCNETNLRSLDLSSNILLETLKIDILSGFDVDLSNNVALTSLSANSSDLTSLNIQNGNNANITSFDARNNQFTCIQVDDATASYLSTWQKDNTASFELDCSVTNIPDIDFEYHLENHDANGNVVPVGSFNSMGNGIVDDGKVFTSRIKNVTSLNISGNSIGELDGLEAFESLEILDCSENNFNEFDFSQLPELKELYIHDLFFAVLNVSSNLKLEKLIYNNANSTTLNLGANTVIKELNIGGNNITSFDVSAYTTLEILNIDDNYQIVPINIRPLTNLKDLKANNTNLSALDLSQNLLLESLEIDRASGFYLDVSNNTALTRLSARTSDMSGINIQNGNNANITYFDTEQNSATMSCIQVDDPAASFLNTWDVDSNIVFRLDCGETNVPDDNFENYLETHDANGNVVAVGDATSMGNGIANDNKVYTSNISGVVELDISGLTISDATGIEGFLALQNFNCFNNSLSSIDLSQNVELQSIAIGRNNLTSLDLLQNSSLTFVSCIRNQITNLNVSQNTMLENLYCSNNQLNNLNVTNNPTLKNLSCYSNPLGSLDVTQNLLLEDLDCVENNLTVLDVTQNLELLELDAYDNELTSLDVSNNVKLVELFIESNQITSLDLSKNIVIEDVSCAYNELTYLNLRNGNNTNLNPNDFDIRNNPGLTCVTVDDVAYANTTFTRKDAQTEFKLFCTETNIPDDNFEAYLETHNATGGIVSVGDPTSMGNGIANDDKVGTERIQNIMYLNISNQGITDLTGLKDFSSLEQLRAFNNTITSGSLDLTANSNLTEIYCSDMGLNTVDVSGLTKLERLEFRNNNLSSIDVSSNSNLNYFNVDRNNFTTVNVSGNTLLSDLRIRDNVVLNSLDVSNNSNLVRLYVGGNSLAVLDVSNKTLLETISAGENQLTTIDVNGLNNLTDLFLEDMPTLTSLDVSSNINLEDIGVSNTGLSVLDLSSLTKLIEVYVNNTGITELDFSASPDVEYIECTNGQLTSLNLKNGNNSSSIELYATGNSNLLCIQVDDPTASYLSSWEKDDTAIFGQDCNWTYIPDDIFETYLEDNGYGNGIANDDYVSTEAVEAVTDLTLYNLAIADFTGLEEFTNLEKFRSTYSTATDLDFTSNTKLIEVRCSDMDLNSIDLTGLTALTELYLYKCDLNSLDISTNTGLDDLVVSENNLTSLDVSNNLLLTDLQFHENNVTEIDISMLTNLESFKPSHNEITSLDLSNNLALRSLSIGRNPIDELDISMLTNLESLFAYELNISSLDISNNTRLDDILCSENANLSYLNLRNGNNAMFEDMDATDNPNLTCIEVDDPSAAYLSASNWEKDATANYSKYCRLTYIPDANFESYLETHKENTGGTTLGNDNSLGNGVLDNYVPTEKIEDLEILFIENQNISDFTGLEEFKGLERLRAYGNPVNGNLDLSNNINLTQVFCWDMGLTGINLTGLTTLYALDVRDNDLTTIDVTTNTIVESINVENNKLTSLDVTQNTELTELQYGGNTIQTIDLSQNPKLITLVCHDNTISNIYLQNNTLIETLEIGNNPIASLDVSIFPNLVNFYINNTNIASIDLSNNLDVSTLICNDTAITELDLSNNANMYTLEVHNNALTELNFGNLSRLNNFNCSNNQLTALNLKNGNNDNMTSVDLTGNPGLTCLEVDDPMASYLSSWSKDATANYAEYCRLTYVPDDIFEAFLESQGYGNGVANDNYVYTALVEVSEGIIFQNKTASDLTGIEDFRDAWYFVIRNNPNLTSIDLSQNTKLTTLGLQNNNLTSIDLSNNVILDKLYISDNENLGSIDVSMLSVLTTLSASNTGMSTVDISNNPLLRVLNLNDNNFTSLDLSPYASIIQLRIVNNQLTSLNVANGNNDNFTWFDAQGNSGLTCIKADKVVQLHPDIWVKDATASFALYCDVTYIADANFENYLETHDANGNVVSVGDALSMGNGIANDNQVATEKIETVVTLNIESQNIADLTGIEAFAALENLNLDYNDLTTLDLSNNSNLRVLDVAENDLTELDLSVIPTLEEVQLRSNKISNLILDNPNLKILNASKNPYTSLDVTNCPQLEELGVTQTLLVSLDVRNGNNNLMADFNARFNDYLTCIEVDDASASYLSTWDKDTTASFSEDCNNAVWTGVNGTDWTNNGNWSSNTVAETTQNVVVPVLVTSPIITSGVIAEMNDLRIEELSSFTVEDNGVTIVNGNFSTTETINIQSSATTSGTFIVKGTANGNVTFERSSLEANKWSMITAPVSGQSIKQFVENSANNIRINTTVTPNRYAVGYYDDSRADGTKWVYYTVDDLASDAVTFEEGKSYIVSRETNGSVTFTGTLETNDLSVGVATEQWNAIGSPYTAYLPVNNNADVNFIQENLSKFDPAYVGVYVWDNDQNKYVAKTLVSAATSLTVGQGFFVRTATGVTTMNFSEEQRLHNGAEVAAFSRGINSEIPTIQITAEQDGVVVDTNIKYITNTTKGLDAGYDIGNFGGSAFDVFTHLVESSENKDFTIQSLPNSDYETTVIPLGIVSETGKEIKLSVNTTNLPSGVNVYIEDRETGSFTQIDGGNLYRFTTTTKLTGIGRFYIHTSAKTLDIEDVVGVNETVEIFKSGKQEITIKGLQRGEIATVKLYAVLGSEVYSSKIVGDTVTKITPIVVETGIYIVKVEGETVTTSKKIVFNK